MVLGVSNVLLSSGILVFSSIETHTPRVLIVTSSFPPYLRGVRQVITDLLEYGIVPNVTGTQVYVSMDRSNYDIIIFAGHSNPVDPGKIVAAANEDASSGRKLVFLGSLIFEETYPSSKAEYALKQILGMPSGADTYQGGITPRFNSTDFAKEGRPVDIHYASYFNSKPPDTIAYISDAQLADHYYLLMNARGAWVSWELKDFIDFGKVIGRLWFTTIPFGFSLNRKAGLPIVVWRVDADDSDNCEELAWIDSLATQFQLEVSVGAVASKISNASAACWRKLAQDPLVEVVVHSYYHGSYDTDIVKEVVGTYETLLAYGVQAKKVFLGWSDSTWNSSQIETLYSLGWDRIDSSRSPTRSGSEPPVLAGDYEGLGIDDRYSVYVLGNFTAAPPIPGLNAGLIDFYAWQHDIDFVNPNQLSFRVNSDRMLPFLFLTHDYSGNEGSFADSHGSLREQVTKFLAWLIGMGISSIPMSEFLDLYSDANRGMIYQDGDQFTVIRVGKVNEVKIFVGSKEPMAIGSSVLSQAIVGGWLYVSLRNETKSVFRVAYTSPISTSAEHSSSLVIPVVADQILAAVIVLALITVVITIMLRTRHSPR
jgi:hypothetical protein